MKEKGLNGYSENTKKILIKTGLSVEKIKDIGLDQTYLKLKGTASTDKETSDFIEEIFETTLVRSKIIELIRSSAIPSSF